MDTYNFTYRRIKGECLHCRKLESRSLLKKMVDGLFRKKALRLKAEKECEMEWRSFEVMGHSPENYTETTTRNINGQQKYESVNTQDRTKMVLYFKNGSLMTVSNWQDCEIKLDTDWVLFTKKKMERESGQDVKLAVDAGS